MLNLPWVIITEAVMTGFIIWIIAYLRKNSRGLTLRSFSVSVILLTMMGSMFDALIYYMAMPRTFFNVVLAANISMIAMAIAIVYILWTAVRERDYSMKRGMALAFALILGWNEVSMALFLRILGYYFHEISSAVSYLAYFGLSVTNFLFLAPMIAEMVFFIAFRLSPGLGRRISTALLLMQVADPAIAGNSPAVIPLLIAYSIIMIYAVYYAFSYVYRNRRSMDAVSRRLVGWFIFIFALSTAGLLEPVVVHGPFGLSWFIFALSMMSSMVLYFEIVLGMFSPVPDRTPASSESPVTS
ncbi:MAG: hypothetical protein QXN26_02255 [Thermoplasmataceae archaeon]